MLYKDYLILATKTLPHSNFDKIPNLTPPEMLKLVAVELFLRNDITSILAEETKTQLIHLQTESKTNFDKTENPLPEEKLKSWGGGSEFA